MKSLKKILTASLMLCLLAAGAFAFDDQDKGQKPPPKQPKEVVVQEKKDPPRNNNGGGSRPRDENRDNRDRRGGRP